MITLDEHFGKFKSLQTIQLLQNSCDHLIRVNLLLQFYTLSTGKQVKEHPVSGHLDARTEVSGEQYGGVRPLDCPIGAKDSSHKQGLADDVYDPDNAIDNWATDEILERFGLYREHPSATNGWCHLTSRRPLSGNRTFYP